MILSREMAIQEAKDCPSGRLVVWNEDGTPVEPAFEAYIGAVGGQAMGYWVLCGSAVAYRLCPMTAPHMRCATVCRCAAAAGAATSRCATAPMLTSGVCHGWCTEWPSQRMEL